MGEAGFWLQQLGRKQGPLLGTLIKDEGLKLGTTSGPQFPSESSGQAGVPVGLSVLFH